jgi:hypothetical protein
MMMVQFKQPSSTPGIDWKALYGSLLLVTPLRVETGIQTRYGVKDAVVAEVVVLDGEQAGRIYREERIFQALLQSQLRPLIGSGDRQLGRLTQGPPMKGQSPPWLLGEFTDAEEKLAAAYLGGGAIGTGELGETGDENPPSDAESPSDDCPF